MQTLQYSQEQDHVHHSGTAARPGPNGEDGEFGSVEEDGDGDAGRPPTKRRPFSQHVQQACPPSAFNRFCSSSPTPAATAAGLSNSMDFSFSSLLGGSASVLLNSTLSDDQQKPADNPNLDTPRRPHTPH